MNKCGAILYILVSLAMILGFPIVLWQEFRRSKWSKTVVRLFGGRKL
jgi:hypothetical protein